MPRVADSLEEAGDKLFTFTRFPPSSGNRSEPRTRSSDCTRSSSAGSRLRPCCPAPKPPPCCSGRCSPQDRSPCARSTDGRPSPRNQTIRSLTSPHDRIASCRPKTRQSIPTKIATGPSGGLNCLATHWLAGLEKPQLRPVILNGHPPLRPAGGTMTNEGSAPSFPSQFDLIINNLGRLRGRQHQPCKCRDIARGFGVFQGNLCSASRKTY